MSNSIVFIKGEPGFMVQAVLKNMQSSGLDVIEVDADIAEIERHQYDSNIILYYMGSTQQVTKRVLECLSGMCKEFRKTLCLIGDSESLYTAEKTCEQGVISVTYNRPIDVRSLVDDLKHMLGTHEEYARKKTILLVDDDTDFLQIANTWFSGTYVIDTVNSAKEALKYLNNKKPDLILLDYEMPKMSGYELLTEIRRAWKTADIPVIFLTGKDDKDSVMKIIDKKPDGYLLKSTPKDQLLSSIDKFFADYILGGRAAAVTSDKKA